MKLSCQVAYRKINNNREKVINNNIRDAYKILYAKYTRNIGIYTLNVQRIEDRLHITKTI